MHNSNCFLKQVTKQSDYIGKIGFRINFIEQQIYITVTI